MPSTDHASARPAGSAGHVLSAVLLTAAGYFAGTEVGLLLTPSGLAVSVMWPPNAILLAALLLAPVSRWPWYVLAVVPVHFMTQALHGIPIATSAGWFVTNTTEAVLGAACLRYLRNPVELFQTFTGVLLFLLVAVVGATGITSFMDAGVVVLTDAGDGYWDMWQRRFASNALATLTLVPLIVMLAASPVRRFRVVGTARYVEGGLLALGTLVVVNFVFAALDQTQASITAVTYTVLPLMLWAAVRFGPTGVSVLQLVSTAGILAATLNRDAVSLDDVLSLQMFLAVVNGLSLSMAVVVRESRRLQSLHSAVLRSMRHAVAITDSDGVVLDANESWAAATRVAGVCRLDGVPVHANYLAQQKAAASESPHAARLVTGLEDVLAGTRKLFEMEYSCRTGDDLRWFFVSVVPLWGEQHGAVITHSDITRRKQEEAETTQMREELAHSGRVMTMGMLSAALTHELSQPLAAILGNAQAARRLCARSASADPGEIDVILGDVVAASRRAGTILKQLRSWFSNGRQDTQALNLNDVVNDVIDILRSDLTRRGVTVARRLTPSLPTVRGDRVQLQQVVLNLMLNACDAMRENAPGDRLVRVHTARCDTGVQLSVEDVGSGIAPDQLAAVFEPFVTTKTSGLGLGLALCKSIVTTHEGQLTAENNSTRGVTFRCVLPVGAEEETEDMPASSRLA